MQSLCRYFCEGKPGVSEGKWVAQIYRTAQWQGSHLKSYKLFHGPPKPPFITGSYRPGHSLSPLLEPWICPHPFWLCPVLWEMIADLHHPGSLTYGVWVVSANGSVEEGRSLFFLHSLLLWTTAVGGYCIPPQLRDRRPCDQLLLQASSSHGAPEALLSPPASSGLCGPSLSPCLPKTTYTPGSFFNVFRHLSCSLFPTGNEQ